MNPSTSPPPQIPQPPVEIANTPQTARSNHRRTLIISICIILVTLLGGLGIYILLTTQNDTKQPSTPLESKSDDNTIDQSPPIGETVETPCYTLTIPENYVKTSIDASTCKLTLTRSTQPLATITVEPITTNFSLLTDDVAVYAMERTELLSKQKGATFTYRKGSLVTVNPYRTSAFYTKGNTSSNETVTYAINNQSKVSPVDDSRTISYYSVRASIPDSNADTASLSLVTSFRIKE